MYGWVKNRLNAAAAPNAAAAATERRPVVAAATMATTRSEGDAGVVEGIAQGQEGTGDHERQRRSTDRIQDALAIHCHCFTP